MQTEGATRRPRVVDGVATKGAGEEIIDGHGHRDTPLSPLPAM